MVESAVPVSCYCEHHRNTRFVFQISPRETTVYNSRNYNLIRDRLRALTSLRITYKDEIVTDLSLARIALWNRGRETINSDDIAPKDPLRIEVPVGARVLEASLDFVTSPVNGFTISLDEDRRAVAINFDYMHTNEGCVLSIYHTSTEVPPAVLGTIKGVGGFSRAVLDKDELQFAFLDNTVGLVLPERLRRRRLMRPVFFVVFLLVALPMMVVGVIEDVLRWLRKPPAEFSLQADDGDAK